VSAAETTAAEIVAAEPSEDEKAEAGKRRRRGRRGGRRGAEDEAAPAAEAAEAATPDVVTVDAEPAPVPVEAPADEKPAKPKRRGRKQVPITVEGRQRACRGKHPRTRAGPSRARNRSPRRRSPSPNRCPKRLPHRSCARVAVSNPSAYVYVDTVDPAKPKKAGWWSKK